MKPDIGILRVTRGLVVLLAIASPGAAFAGPPQERRGFWWSVGLGYGSAHIECDQCASGDREGSFAGWLRLGGTIGSHLLLGWEASGWLKNDKGRLEISEDVVRTLGSSAVVVVFYPRASSGFSVRLGAGLSYAGLPPRPTSFCPPSDLSCLGDRDEGAHGNGFGMTAGAGYDFRVGAKVSMAADFTLTVGGPGGLRANGRPPAVTGWRHDVLAFGVGVTFH